MKLGTYILYRLIGMVAQVLGAIALMFALIQIIPYDPTVIFLFNLRSTDPKRQAQLLAEYKRTLGIDIPIYEQYLRFFKNLLFEGTLGRSWGSDQPVEFLLGKSLKFTVITFGIAFLIYTPLAFGLGILAARYRGTLLDNSIRVFTTATYSIPSYILGLWFVILALDANLAPWPSPPPSDPGALLKYAFLPIVTVVLIYTGFQFRLVRAHMLNILRSDYIRTARAKGLHERVVIYKHALRNALPFFITTVAVTFPVAFSGIAALEVVFSIPGVGFLMVIAANNFDWPVLIGLTAFFTAVNAILLGITDILIFYTSPKVRFGYRSRIG